MQKLCYKNYRFNYNPAVLRINAARSVCRMSAPFAGEAVIDMGARAREVSGEGEFFGENALAAYQNLYAVFAEGGCGVLCVPGQKPFSAHFTDLKMLGEGASVRYSFTFVEDIGFKGSADGGKRLVHIAKENETLWSIAAAYGTTAEALLTLNPDIISPATVQIGQTVIVGKTSTLSWWDTQY